MLQFVAIKSRGKRREKKNLYGTSQDFEIRNASTNNYFDTRRYALNIQTVGGFIKYKQNMPITHNRRHSM